MSLCASGDRLQVTQDMKWKHLYNKLGLSSQITSASYSLKMAYKKHLFPFEEHQRTNDDKDRDTATDNNYSNGMPSPTNKIQDQQSGDEDCRSMTAPSQIKRLIKVMGRQRIMMMIVTPHKRSRIWIPQIMSMIGM